jgi:hypothetical protein
MQSIAAPGISQEDSNEFKKSPNSGLISSISFNNPDFWSGIKKMFDPSPHEFIMGVTITENGVSAKFGYKKT